MRTRHTPRNWDNMSRAQKRVAVAKDVLVQIEARRLKMCHNGYTVLFYGDEISDEAQYSDVSEDMRCEACALGAAFLSTIRFKNKRTLEDIEEVTGGGVREEMKGIFPVKQLDLMESAFERKFMFQTGPSFWSAELFVVMIKPNEEGEENYDFRHLSEARKDALRTAVKFGKAFKKPEDRAVAIYQNIIDHKGDFNPVAEYEVSEVTA